MNMGNRDYSLKGIIMKNTSLKVWMLLGVFFFLIENKCSATQFLFIDGGESGTGAQVNNLYGTQNDSIAKSGPAGGIQYLYAPGHGRWGFGADLQYHGLKSNSADDFTYRPETQ